MSYKQLTFEQRVAIKAYLQIELAFCRIAQHLGIHKAAVSRELQRNTRWKKSELRQRRPED